MGADGRPSVPDRFSDRSKGGMKMEKMKVRELMRPVEEFPRISSQSTFMDAVDALEKAQQEFSSGKASQRILLVCDEEGWIVGSLTA